MTYAIAYCSARVLLIVPLNIILLTKEETYLLQPTLPQELEIAYRPSINPIMTDNHVRMHLLKNSKKIGCGWAVEAVGNLM